MTEKTQTFELTVQDRRTLHELINIQFDGYIAADQDGDDDYAGLSEFETVGEFRAWADKMISMLGTP